MILNLMASKWTNPSSLIFHHLIFDGVIVSRLKWPIRPKWQHIALPTLSCYRWYFNGIFYWCFYSFRPQPSLFIFDDHNLLPFHLPSFFGLGTHKFRRHFERKQRFPRFEKNKFVPLHLQTLPSKRVERNQH